MKVDYYKVISEFCSYPKDNPNDLTLDFFNFLEKNYLVIWVNLVLFYSDDSVYEGLNPRLHLYGWDNVASVGRFNLFLPALKNIWLYLTENDIAKCFYCQEDSQISTEHSIIVSYDYAPVVKYYDVKTLDGAIKEEVAVCRKCAIEHYLELAPKANSENVECWV